MLYLSMNIKEQSYWTNRYQEKVTGWDIGHPSTPIISYIDQLKDKNLKILIPGAGYAYEAEYIYKSGFKDIYVLDISESPLNAFKERNPEFPKTHLFHEDFFSHIGAYDLIIEQTFFCSFVPTKENRTAYVKKMSELLKPKGKLVGLWFNFPLSDDIEKRPFGGDKKLYNSYLNLYFTSKIFEKCYNSIPERTNKELFGIFEKKE